MTNEEKANEMFPDVLTMECVCQGVREKLIEMAEWKDQQFSKEKKALIDKVCEVLEIRLSGDYCMSKDASNYFIMKFRKTMEEL